MCGHVFRHIFGGNVYICNYKLFTEQLPSLSVIEEKRYLISDLTNTRMNFDDYNTVSSDEEYADKKDENWRELWEKWDTWKYATIFVIDNSPAMFDANDKEDCLFKVALSSCLKTLEKYVFSSYYNTMAITVLDSREQNVKIEFNNNVLKSIETLNDFIKKSNDELKSIFCTKDINSQVFYESITSSLELYRKYGPNMKMTKRHIVLLTSVSDPSNCDKADEELEHAIQKLKSFEIELVIIPLVQNFKWENFYKDLINKSIIDEERDLSIEEFSCEGYSTVEKLQPVMEHLVQSRKCIRRAIFYYLNIPETKANIPNFFYVQVQWFTKEKKIVRNCTLDPATLRECVTYKPEPEEGTSRMEESSSSLLNDKKFMKMLTKHEMKGFTLLYLSEQRSDPHYFLNPWFVVQADELYKVKKEEDEESQGGENPFTKKGVNHFDYIWEHCHVNNKVLICTYFITAHQNDCLVELTPDRYNGAPCFIGKFLPSASSCKVLPIERPESNTNIDIHTAKELVKKLTIRNGKKCFKIYEQEYEDKANMIKGLMFSNDASEGWELEEPPENWCSTSEIAERLTTDLMQSFEQEYLSQTQKRNPKVQSKASTSKRGRK